MADEQVRAIMPQFTLEDFLHTSKPFEWLYDRRGDRFVARQYLEQMRAQAKALKVTAFSQMWNEYVADRARASGISLENVTAFDGQALELLCGEYNCDDAGITIVDKYGVEIVVCAHPILPVRRLISVDSGEVKIELAFKRRGAWIHRIVEKSTISDARKIIDLSTYSIDVDSENARELVKYLSFVENANYTEIPEIRSVGRLGWIGDYGFSPYVDGLAFDGEPSFRYVFDAVQPVGSAEKWLAAAREIRQNGTVVSRLVLAAAFASALIAPCQALPFFLHLWGGTEAGKTVALMLAASVWASPTMGKYIHTFNATSVGQELLAGFLNSLPLCIDELMIVNDRRDFDSMVYALTEGVGRNRGAKGGGIQRTQTWRNCMITTGETPITTDRSGGGAVNRILEVNCRGVQIFDDPQVLVETISQNYGHAGRMMVEALKEEETLALVTTMQREYYAQLIKKEVTEKQAQAGSMLLAADAFVAEAVFHDGRFLSPGDVLPYLKSGDDVSVNVRAYGWLLDWISSNAPRFTKEESRERYGAMDERRAYIIKGVFDRAVQEAGYSSAAFTSWLVETGKIECDGKTPTKTKRLTGIGYPNGGAVTRCVWVILPQDG